MYFFFFIFFFLLGWWCAHNSIIKVLLHQIVNNIKLILRFCFSTVKTLISISINCRLFLLLNCEFKEKTIFFFILHWGKLMSCFKIESKIKKLLTSFDSHFRALKNLYRRCSKRIVKCTFLISFALIIRMKRVRKREISRLKQTIIKQTIGTLEIQVKNAILFLIFHAIFSLCGRLSSMHLTFARRKLRELVHFFFFF